jgi:acetyltransferase-like isoleucine patch superfamily enzyme
VNGVLIYSGKLTYGSDTVFGKNVVVDVAEEVVIGDRCVIPDNAYFGGRRVEIADDFYGYSWEWRRLDIGRGRRDDEHAILKVGSRCTFHDNRIDLARQVIIGDDVGLSPEVTIYTHGYWQSPLEGYPCKYATVTIDNGTIIGYRSTLLPGTHVGPRAVVGAHALATGTMAGGDVYGGSPARRIDTVIRPMLGQRQDRLREIFHEYMASLAYRKIDGVAAVDYPMIEYRGCVINADKLTIEGDEDEYTDDLRWFLFTRGIRIYTRRRFKKMGKQ